jgi:hypothetical protein
MTTANLAGRLVRATAIGLLATAISFSAIVPALAGSNMDKVDIVAEGIDLKPLHVGANANGYTGTEATAHKFIVRVFAKAKGQNRVYNVQIHGLNSHILFEKHVGKTEGWQVYGKSHEVYSKPQNLKWLTVPVQVCKENMAKMIASGKTKAQVLANDRTVTAHALIGFTAYADSKSNNKKNKHNSFDGVNPHSDNIYYPVSVVCRAAL